MSREWKPGDVAMATACWTRGRPPSEALAIRRIRGWERVEDSAFAYEFVSARPIAVIDPEDLADTQRLGEAYCAVNNVSIGPNVAADRIQAALREFANPTPRVEEPTGLGAVVEDSDGDVWARRRNGLWEDLSGPPGDCRPWASLHERYGPLTILSHGVSPEDAS